MPFPVQRVNDNIDILIPFCFRSGGNKIAKFFLFHKKNSNTYFFREFKIIEGKPQFVPPGIEYYVDDEGKSFLLHLFDDEKNHLEHDFVLPVFNSQQQSAGFFEGSFKYVLYNEDCDFKKFVLGHPPPSDSAVSSILEFAAGKEYISSNENKRSNRQARSRNNRKSRKSRKSRIGKSRIGKSLKHRKNLISH